MTYKILLHLQIHVLFLLQSSRAICNEIKTKIARILAPKWNFLFLTEIQGDITSLQVHTTKPYVPVVEGESGISGLHFSSLSLQVRSEELLACHVLALFPTHILTHKILLLPLPPSPTFFVCIFWMSAESKNSGENDYAISSRLLIESGWIAMDSEDMGLQSLPFQQPSPLQAFDI